MTMALRGLIAAALTPMAPDGALKLSLVEPWVEKLLSDGVEGFYVCGSTGEGMSLSSKERMDVATAYVQQIAQRVPVFVQIGHNSLEESRSLARHAQEIGATAISATCPNYFPVDSVEVLARCMQRVAEAAPQLPFYYYHIPSLTGSNLSMPRFLELASRRIPNLAGLKFTSPELHTFAQCCHAAEGALQIAWGTDEMLLPALAMGANSAIGSTYNIATPLYQELVTSFRSQNIEVARDCQWRSIKMIEVLKQFPFQSALKYLLSLRAPEVEATQEGTCRLPLKSLTLEQKQDLTDQLSAIDFFD